MFIGLLIFGSTSKTILMTGKILKKSFDRDENCLAAGLFNCFPIMKTTAFIAAGFY
jgi:hypothetical protein